MSCQKYIYEKFWRGTFGPRHVPKLQAIVKMVSQVEKLGMILDMGCGDGIISLGIKESSKGIVLGIDISRECLIKAVRRVDEAILCNLETNLPFKDAVFDLCVGIDIIEHVVDTDLLLSEAYRILRPEGYLILITPNLAAFFERTALLMGFQPQNVEVSKHHKFGSVKSSPSVGHVKAFTKRALEEILRFYNFKIIKVATTTYHTGILRFIDTTLGKFSKSLASLLIILARKE